MKVQSIRRISDDIFHVDFLDQWNKQHKDYPVSLITRLLGDEEVLSATKAQALNKMRGLRYSVVNLYNLYNFSDTDLIAKAKDLNVGDCYNF
jgi:uncharacterized protein YutE (UPF0331/DUF86 family)